MRPPSFKTIGSYLREYWLWILLPLVLILAGLAVLILMGTGGDQSAPFLYDLF